MIIPIMMSSFHVYIVPDPRSVMISSTSHNISSLVRPIGSNVTLTCAVTVELSPAVDVPVTVTTMWTGPDGFMTTNTAQPVMGSTTTYTTTAMVSSFGRDQSGIYNCTATVSSTSPLLQYTLPGINFGVAMLTVGKIIFPPSRILLLLLSQ